MSKKVAVVITSNDAFDYFQVDVRDLDDDIYMLGIEHYQEDLEIAKTEVVADRKGLIELRDSLDLMIGDSND